MARLAFTVAGAAIGSVVPGVGTALGASIGGFIGGLVDPGPGQTGPRLTDLAAAPSTHGSPIPQVVGTALVACDQIWVNDNKLTERKSSSSAKGGPEVTTYSYYGTFAVAICEGEIDAVKRVWAGDKLIADLSSEKFDEIDDPSVWSQAASLAIKAAMASVGVGKGVNFRIYKGAETQEPDPLIEADRTHAPAYRGLAYMVFEDLPLDKYGNAIPPIRVEVVKDATLSTPVIAWETLSGGLRLRKMYDPVREVLWTAPSARLTAHSAEDGGIVVDINHTGKPHPFAGVLAVDDTFGETGAFYGEAPPLITPDGSRLLVVERQPGLLVGYSFVHAFDTATGAWRASYTTYKNFSSVAFETGFGPLGVTEIIPQYNVVRTVTEASDLYPGGRRWLYAVVGSPRRIGYGWIGAADTGALATMDGAAQLSASYIKESIALDFDSSGRFIYAIGTLSGDAWVEKIRVDDPASCPATPVAGAATVASANLGSIIGATVGCKWDRDADVFCIWGISGVAILDSDLNVVSSTSLTLDNYTSSGDGRSVNMSAGASSANDGFVWLSGPAAFYKISTSTAAVLDSVPRAQFPDEWLAETGPLFDLGGSGGVLAARTDFTRPGVFFPDLVSANRVSLRSACEIFAGLHLPAARIDASGLSGTIHGYAVKSASATARAVLEDLGEINAFDMAEIDGAITFIPRGGASEGTISEADLGLPKFTQTIAEAAILPRRIEVNYLGVESQYQPAQQAWQYPAEIGAQGATVRVQTNQVLTDAEGYAVAARSGAVALIERHQVEFKTNWRYQRVAPASIETVMVDGAPREVKVREIDGAWTLEMRGTLHDAAAYVVEGAPVSNALSAPVLDLISTTDFELLDMALLRDEDDDYGLYVAAWPRFSSRRWGGAAIYRATDGLDYSDWIPVDTSARSGRAETAFPAPDEFDLWDRASTLTLVMEAGVPTSATEDAVLTSDVNAIAIQSGDDWEIVQYASAADNGDGTWTLSTFLRGQRGTEHLAGGHAAGDRVIFLDQAALRRGGAADYGLLRYYGAATFGDEFDPFDAFAQTNLGRGKRPYSVALLEGVRDGSDDVDLSWVRRSRIHSGPWPYSRPLGEASESYQIEIIDPDDGVTVADTQTVSTPAFSFTASANSTLFGTVKSNVPFRVSQVGDWGAGPSVEVIV